MSLSTKPFYFLHIPKTAGTSLLSWLRDFFAVEDYLECFDLEPLEQIPLNKLSQYRLFSGHFGLELYNLFPGPLDTITWLREPIALQISQYNYFRSNREKLLNYFSSDSRSKAIKYLQAANELSLVELCQQYQGYVDNLQVRYLAGNAPRYAAGKYECNEDMLETAKNNLLELLHFGFCEWMQPSIELLCYRAKWPPRKFDLHLNRGSTSTEDMLARLSADELAILRNLNKYDSALYEFAKTEFKQRYRQMWENCSQVVSRKQLIDSSKIILADTPFKQQGHEVQELIHQLLEENFCCHAEKQTNHFYIKFSEAVFTSGWYPREYHAPLKTWVRWAGPETASSIYLALKVGLSYRISFWLLMCLAPDIQDSLRIEVNDVPIEIERIYVGDINNTSQTLVTGVIPAELMKEETSYTKLTFKVNRVMPLGINTGVSKQTSFAIDGLYIEPLTMMSLVDSALQLNTKLQEKDERIWYLEYVYKEAWEGWQTAQTEGQQLQHKLEQERSQYQHKLEQERSQYQQIHTELGQSHSELSQVREELKEIDSRRKQLDQELKQTQIQLQQAQARIAAMETSKFWHLRKTWFRLKQTLGVGQGE